MKRRTFLQTGFGLTMGGSATAAMRQDKLDAAADVLQQCVLTGTVDAASMYVRHQDRVFSKWFGAAKSEDAVFLLASISKPICIAAVMALRDRRAFDLLDPVCKWIPEFVGEGRGEITMQQLMTHVSGLPDQLPENARLRARHAPLNEFVEAAIATPLLFAPGSRYSYSSMGILLAAEVAQRISGRKIATLVDENVFQPLDMKHSALGMGRLKAKSLMRCQVESAAPESGAGDPTAKKWDWNSDYWRRLGSPWGGAHGSAVDVASFLDAFLRPPRGWLDPQTVRAMITNRNPPGVRPRGLGFDLGISIGGAGASDRVFGHGGSTGTLCWADPTTDSSFVVLTTLPSAAVDPHPRESVSKLVAEAIR